MIKRSKVADAYLQRHRIAELRQILDKARPFIWILHRFDKINSESILKVQCLLKLLEILNRPIVLTLSQVSLRLADKAKRVSKINSSTAVSDRVFEIAQLKINKREIAVRPRIQRIEPIRNQCLLQ